MGSGKTESRADGPGDEANPPLVTSGPVENGKDSAVQRAASVTSKVVLVLFFAAAFWLRINSLEAFPDLDGDETWYGTQASHITQGEPAYLQTPTGNPLNPF